MLGFMCIWLKDMFWNVLYEVFRLLLGVILNFSISEIIDVDFGLRV